MKKIDSKIKGFSVSTQDTKEEGTTLAVSILDVPAINHGVTYTLHDGISDSAVHVTINHTEHQGKLVPIQLFINSKDPNRALTIQLIGRLASAIFRQGHSLDFLPKELIDIRDSSGYWHKGKFYNSWVSRVGYILQDHLNELNGKDVSTLPSKSAKGVSCPACGSTNTKMESGCVGCNDCGYSKCG